MQERGQGQAREQHQHMEPTGGKEDLETGLTSEKHWRVDTVRKELGNLREN